MRGALLISVGLHIGIAWLLPSVRQVENPKTIQNPIWLAPSRVPVARPSELSRPASSDGRESVPSEQDSHTEQSTGTSPVSHLRFEQVVSWGNAPPDYPEEARVEGWEGSVLLELQVEEGRVLSIETESSSGYRVLDEAAREAARAWSLPRSYSGTLRVPIEFRLN